MKKRLYKKGEPFRDARLFVIACEGEKREKEYFEYFNSLSQRIKIKVLEHETKGKSAPKWVLDNAASYAEEFGLNANDQLWLVMDTDRWKREVFTEIQHHCSSNNWNMAISNPCFEVWLYMHIQAISKAKANDCKRLKAELDSLIRGGYNVKTFISKIDTAIFNAQAADKTPKHYYPEKKQTKVYKLIEEIKLLFNNNISGTLK